MRLPLLTAVLALALAGCQDPYAVESGGEDSPRPAAPRLLAEPPGDARAPRADDRDTAPTLRSGAQRTSRAAVSVFCTQWANWSWRTIERQQQRLTRLAAGPLARELAAEAKLRRQDRALRRDRLGNRGRVVAIDVKPGSRIRNAVCVTSEQQRAGGRVDLEGARHRVYLATAAQTRNRWAVTRWEPQP